MSDIGIKYLILYVFLIENWFRFESEVNYIMNFLVNFFKIFLLELIEKNVKIEIIGFYEGLL